MKVYLRLLAGCYLLGAALHALDLFNVRLAFNGMLSGWKVWIIFLHVADLFAALGLWHEKTWGVALFLLIASVQLVAYVGFSGYFGNQLFLIVFHVIALGVFALLSL